jgi:hypothetical protein
MIARVSKERVTVSLDQRAAARVRQCAAGTRGGASGYIERLIRDDEMRDAVADAAAWYGAHPDAERAAELDAIEAELARLAPAEQAAELRRLGLTE